MHLDGYNQLPVPHRPAGRVARKEFIYFNDDGDLVAHALRELEVVFCGAARARAPCGSGREPFTKLRVPKMFDLRIDPYERADITSNTYYDWFFKLRSWPLPAQALVAQFLDTFKEFPPRQRPSSFSVDQIMETLKRPQNG